MRLLGALLAALLLSSCASGDSGSDDGTIGVVASFYPLAEMAKRIGGDHVTVENLTPVGVEPHDVELTTDDVDAIEDADVVLFVGDGFQANIAKAAERRDDGSLDVAATVTDGNDPHFWLDPSLMAKAVEPVLDLLIAADPDHVDEFTANAELFGRELAALDERFSAALETCERRELVTSHDAFGYLAKRYKLTQYSISGVSPEAEASPARLAELEELVRDKGVTTIFYEELVPRDFADTLAKETGAATAVLNPLEGLSKSEQDRGDDYLSVMGRNREALAKGLGCS